MKHLLLFLILTAFALEASASTNPDSLSKKIAALRDSIVKHKEAGKKAPFYSQLYTCYDELGNHYLAAYKDSARQCLDSILLLVPSPKKETEKEDTSRYNFRFKIYTDFVGFQGDQPNGLVQSEVSFAWNINKKALGILKYRKQENKHLDRYQLKSLKKRIRSSNGMDKAQKKDSLQVMKVNQRSGQNCITPFANVVFPIIAISKVKDSLRYKDLNYDPVLNIKHIHTFDLVKFSNFSICGKLNLLTFRSRNKSIMAFTDLFGTFYSTGVYDHDTLLSAKDQKHNINSVGYGISGKIQFAPPTFHFSMEVSLVNFNLKLLNNNIRQAKGKQYYPDTNPDNNAFNTAETLDAISIWTTSIRYSTKANKDNKNNDGYFLRIAFYNNITVGLINQEKSGSLDYNNNFLQVQFGISKNMSDLLKFLKP